MTLDELLVCRRIHAIILTKNRPATLKRCVQAALTSLKKDDLLTIIDDSSPEFVESNKEAVRSAGSHKIPLRTYVEFPRAKHSIISIIRGLPSCWLEKTHERDISPIRNLSLLLSSYGSSTNILVDDDIHDFDLQKMYSTIAKFAERNTDIIVGAHIGGTCELDITSRINSFIDESQDRCSTSRLNDLQDLFCVRSPPSFGTRGATNYVSGGYLGFKISHKKLFAFPPGYNEDWNWCLLQSKVHNVKIFHSDEIAIHEPPNFRKPTMTDCEFELYGDLIFDSLFEFFPESRLGIEEFLSCLSSVHPRNSNLPSSRVADLIDKSKQVPDNYMSILEEYGLSSLRRLHASRRVPANEPSVIHDWCHATRSNICEFASILCNQSVKSELFMLMRQGIM